MTDVSELTTGLRNLHKRFVFQGGSPYANSLADALEAQARELDEQIELGTVLAKLLETDRSRLAAAERERDEAVALLRSDTVGLPYWCEQRDAFLAKIKEGGE